MPVTMHMEKDIVEKNTVCLSLDLKDYCEACQLVQEKEKALAFAQSETTSESILVTCAQSQLMEARGKQATAKRELYKICNGLQGDLCWQQIKTMLSEQCPPESLLQRQLSRSVDSASLAIESLDYSFTEFLKNSIDAMVKQYLERKDSQSLLQLSITLEEQEDKITLILKDNAGGLPDSYLSGFESYVHTKSYREPTKYHDKKKQADFFLGGRGLGIPTFLSLLLDGATLEDPARRLYDVKEGETAVEIENASNAAAQASTDTFCVTGACFRITAPILPIPKAEKTVVPLEFELEVPSPVSHKRGKSSASEGGFFSLMGKRCIEKEPALEQCKSPRVNEDQLSPSFRKAIRT